MSLSYRRVFHKKTSYVLYSLLLCSLGHKVVHYKYNNIVSNEKCPLEMQRSKDESVGSLTLGKEALLVGHQASCGGNRQEGGDSHELEETTD